MKRCESPIQMLRYTEDANDGLWTDKAHYLILYAMAHLVRPKVAVEIGSRRGGSAMWIVKAMEEIGDGHLFCVDPFIAIHGGAPGFYLHFEHNLEELGIRDRVTLIKRMSDDPTLEAELPASIDLLFIDGDHSKEATINDIAKFASRVRPGGALIIHDSLCEKGVRQAIDMTEGILTQFFHFTVENRNGIWVGVRI